MHCTGQTSTHARSFTSMHASVMMARPAMVQVLRSRRYDERDIGIDTPGPGSPDIYRAMLATTLIITAMIAVPKRYERRACLSAVRRNAFVCRSVSET